MSPRSVDTAGPAMVPWHQTPLEVEGLQAFTTRALMQRLPLHDPLALWDAALFIMETSRGGSCRMPGPGMQEMIRSGVRCILKLPLPQLRGYLCEVETKIARLGLMGALQTAGTWTPEDVLGSPDTPSGTVH